MIFTNDDEWGIIDLVAGIAQSVEHFTRNEGVESSSLFSSSVCKPVGIRVCIFLWKEAQLWRVQREWLQLTVMDNMHTEHSETAYNMHIDGKA